MQQRAVEGRCSRNEWEEQHQQQQRRQQQQQRRRRVREGGSADQHVGEVDADEGQQRDPEMEERPVRVLKRPQDLL